MRTLMLLLFATAALGQSVTIDGEQYVVGKKVPATQAVMVKVTAYSAKHGDDTKGVFSGYVVSHLPSRHFRVNVSIQMWLVPGDGAMHHVPAVTAKASVDNPVPGKPTKFTASSDQPIHSAAGWRYVYATGVTVEKLASRVAKH